MPKSIGLSKAQKSTKVLGDYEDTAETVLWLTDDRVYEGLEDILSDDASFMCVEMVSVNVNNERSNKKRKRDNDIFIKFENRKEVIRDSRNVVERRRNARNEKGNVGENDCLYSLHNCATNVISYMSTLFYYIRYYKLQLIIYL